MDFQEEVQTADGTYELTHRGEQLVAHYTKCDPLARMDVERESHELTTEILDQQDQIEATRDRFGLEDEDDPDEVLDEEKLAEFRREMREIRPAVSSEAMEPRMRLICENIVEFDGVSWGETDDWPEIARPHQMTILRQLGTEHIWGLYGEIASGLDEGEKKS
jgi:hypothetical protein